MGRNRPGGASKKRGRKRKAPAGPPIPLAPIDLLAGLGPDVDLVADDLPPGIATDAVDGTPTPAVTSIPETGKLLRGGDATIRRLIRTRGVLAGSAAPVTRLAEPDRAGVPRRTPEKPGE
jgi:hypothetical protein